MMEDNKTCAAPNYEAEYDRAMRDLVKAQDESNWLRGELREKELDIRWLEGFKQAVFVIFGKDGCNG